MTEEGRASQEATTRTRQAEGSIVSDETRQLFEELIQEMRSMRAELQSIRSDVALLADEHRESRKMQSPLMGRDLFHDEEKPALAGSR